MGMILELSAFSDNVILGECITNSYVTFFFPWHTLEFFSNGEESEPPEGEGRGRYQIHRPN